MNERHAGGGLMCEYGRYMRKSVWGIITVILTLTGIIALVNSKSFRHLAQIFSYPIAITFVITLALTLPTLTFISHRYWVLARAAKGREIARKKSAEALALLELLSFFAPGSIEEDLLQADVP